MFASYCFHLKCELNYDRFKVITLMNSKDNYVELKFKDYLFVITLVTRGRETIE